MGPPLFSDGDATPGGIVRRDIGGFNGAAALQRRRLVQLAPGETADIASMGPPLFSDGDLIQIEMNYFQ